MNSTKVIIVLMVCPDDRNHPAPLALHMMPDMNSGGEKQGTCRLVLGLAYA
jgi:hypothetical protein